MIHEPTGNEVKDFAVVCCNAFAKEYLRSHRAIKTLCQNLASAGVPCLRFDYSGTGDSFGEEFSFEIAKHDIESAIQYIKNETGLENIKLVAMRLGSAIATSVLHSNSNVKDMVLWDPILEGKDYVKELLLENGIEESEVQKGVSWVSGFSVNPSFLKDLYEYDFSKVNYNKTSDMLIINTIEDAGLKEKIIQNDLKYKLNNYQLNGADNWIHRDRDGNIMMPVEILKDIQTYLVNNHE